MRWCVLSAALLLFAATAFAAAPVASVSSAGDVTLQGVRAPAEGVANWPLLIGDEVVTRGFVATITFKSGLRAVLAENTRAVVEEMNGRPTVRLLSGSMQITRPGEAWSYVRGTQSDAAGIPRRTPPPSTPRPTSTR